jgi:hypothetical protein
LGVPIFAQKGRTPGIAFLIASLITIAPITSAPKLLATATAGPITSGAIFNLDANDVNSISGSSTTWKDLTGNGYDATLSASGSGYSISNDVTNKAISFSNGTIRSQNTGASATIGQAIPSQTWTGFSASFSANMGVGGTPIGGINDWSRVFDFSASGFTQGNGAKGGIFISRYERSNDLWPRFYKYGNSQFLVNVRQLELFQMKLLLTMPSLLAVTAPVFGIKMERLGETTGLLVLAFKQMLTMDPLVRVNCYLRTTQKAACGLGVLTGTIFI